MVKITVKVFATLTQHLSQEYLAQHPQGIRSGAPLEVELREGNTLDDLMDHLGLPKDLVKITFVNGRIKELDYYLEPEDIVGIFPPIAGG